MGVSVLQIIVVVAVLAFIIAPTRDNVLAALTGRSRRAPKTPIVDQSDTVGFRESGGRNARLAVAPSNARACWRRDSAYGNADFASC